MTKISIIVPVYNTKNYLHKCIQSVIGQTCSDWELILVDDGSTDGSSEICDHYSVQYNNIRTIHLVNGGVSNARNMGIDNAQGEWITFLDSDDFLSPDYIAECCQQDGKGVTNLVILPINIVTSGAKSPFVDNYPQTESMTIEDMDCLTADFILEYGITIAKVYNRELLNQYRIRFDTALSTHEDHLFYFSYLPYVKSFCFRHTGIYNYVLEDGNNQTSLSRNLHRYTSYQYAFEHLSSRCKEIACLWNIPYDKLPQIRHFLLYVKLKTVRSAFYHNEDKAIKKMLLSDISRKVLLRWYRVHSVNSLMLKIVLLMPNIVRIKVLELLKTELRK